MDSLKLYKFLIMEIRPLLQSVNVYITLTESKSVIINLNLDHFEIVVDSSRYKVQCRGFHILLNSLSCFSNKQNSVTFRFSTENIDQQLGTSRFEIVEMNKQICPDNNLNIFIKPNNLYGISCFSCSQPFCQNVAFERVMPLPESSDSSDWFCHAHGDGNKMQTYAPKLNEIFYSHCFVHVNEDLLTGFMNDKQILICKHCSAWIGTHLKTNGLKIWLNTVTFNDKNSNFKTTPLDDVFKTIQQYLNSPLLSSIKIILKCQHSGSETHFLLLWILEKKLRVSFDCNLPTFKADEDVCKVLFKFVKDESEVVNHWLNDLNVSTVDVSKVMMVEVLKHLNDMNRFMPEDFSTSNNFYISYLMLYKECCNK